MNKRTINPTDIIGKKFNSWTILEYFPGRQDKNSRTYSKFLCVCECGTKRTIWRGDLLSGKSRSCQKHPCVKNIPEDLSEWKNVTIRFPRKKTDKSLYYIWKNIRQRCLNKNHHAYKYYGGRGITICERWESYDNFLSDMGGRPSLKHSIDRINNEMGYSPENCRWVTAKEQANNRRIALSVPLRKNGADKNCPRCGKNFYVSKSRIKTVYCSWGCTYNKRDPKS